MMNSLTLLLLGSVLVGTATGAPTDMELAVKNNDNVVLERNTRQDYHSCDCLTIVYDHPNFGGRSLVIRQQNADFSNDWFNNRVESAVITGSCDWLFYDHSNFGRQIHGTSAYYILSPGSYNSAASWGGPGNHISSARALPPNGTIAIALFEHWSFRGRMTVLYGSSSHLPSIEFDNQISNVIVFGGTWRLYEHTNYQGTYSEFGPGRYSFPSTGVGNDQVSSAQLFQDIIIRCFNSFVQ